MMKLVGLPTVLKNLNKEIKKMEGTTLKGLIRAAIIVRRDMEVTSPKVPVDTRNLDSSFFIVASDGNMASAAPVFKGKHAGARTAEHSQVVSSSLGRAVSAKRPTVVLGFSASYAWFVHENIGATFQRPGAGAKFFEAGLKRNTPKMLKIIAQEAKIK